MSTHQNGERCLNGRSWIGGNGRVIVLTPMSILGEFQTKKILHSRTKIQIFHYWWVCNLNEVINEALFMSTSSQRNES